MAQLGLTTNRVTVLWDPSQPTTIVEKPFLDRFMPVAEASGVQVVFALYPARSMAVGSSASAADQFCAFAAQLAGTYPQVTKIIVGNEPNQPRFWQPQFNGTAPAAGAAYEALLAKCYDALKAVSPAIDVVGVGLSPRGNDQPKARSNISRSPVRFIGDMSAAYRASGRKAPLMDEFGFHCYPNVNSDALAKGYQWPNIGCVNLDRLKQAIWDGFNGTGQPTIENGLTILLDEVGWQVDTTALAGYTGTENVPPIAASTQASIYSSLVHLVDCDPSITALHFFHLIDETDRDRFQSGLLTIDGSPRDSAASVQQAIAQDAGGCTGASVSWHHSTQVAKAKLLSAKGRSAHLYAEEDYTLKATLSAKGVLAGSVSASGKAYYDVPLKLPKLKKGKSYTLKVVLSAVQNPSRTTTVTKTFIG